MAETPNIRPLKFVVIMKRDIGEVITFQAEDEASATHEALRNNRNADILQLDKTYRVEPIYVGSQVDELRAELSRLTEENERLKKQLEPVLHVGGDLGTRP